MGGRGRDGMLVSESDSCLVMVCMEERQGPRESGALTSQSAGTREINLL